MSELNIFPAIADEAESPAIIAIKLLGSPTMAFTRIPPFSIE